MLLGARMGNWPMFNLALDQLVNGAARGFPLPDFMKAEYQAWPGTEAPWDKRTLRSDPRPKWQAGAVERALYGNSDAQPESGPVAGDSRPELRTPPPIFFPYQ